MEQSQSVSHSMTYDEMSMERSKTFAKALQELKNLRPQLYSAAEYCEKSYLCTEQKQMVVDNLKDYAVKALVNAVDHLGTVAFKLNDLLEQQTIDVSSMGLNLSCLDQKLMTCQTYTGKEGSKQQQLLASIPRHHKHYILPNIVNKNVHFSSQRTYPSGIPASKTLSWHMATRTKSTLNATYTPNAALGTGATITSRPMSGVFCFSNDDNNNMLTKSSTPQTLAAALQKDSIEGSNKLEFKSSFNNRNRSEVDVSHQPIHKSKRVLSSLFAKHKAAHRVRKNRRMNKESRNINVFKSCVVP
ncbi:protein ABIL1-like [Impatiens glandulifera]|uniref:protein ABIL1-like n=1 Tax=Impatiens glandulifera TaxID=253017 RepID=UPI001FB17B36|nr:protein ABIL1-like [Impatiens glandulifera]